MSSWWDAVRNWFRGKRKGDFPEPNRKNPDRVQHFTGREDWIRKRKNLATGLNSREISEEMSAKIRAQSFFAARVEKGHVLDKLREVSDAFTKGEIGQAEARTQLKQFLVSLGYDPQQGGLSNPASTGRLNLILEQNARMAYAVGRWQEGMDPDIKERFPCWRYVGTTSAAPRDSHARYAGHVYSKDDPIWHTIFPPSDFNCKCSVEDCDDPAEVAPKEVQPPESGFSFDPAHAFEEFDYDAIKDAELRAKTRAGVMQMLSQTVPEEKPEVKPAPEVKPVPEEKPEVKPAPEVKPVPEEKPEVKLIPNPKGKPVSTALVVQAKNEEVNKAVKGALAAIDSVHSDGSLSPDTAIYSKPLRIGLHGETVLKSGKYHINISTGASHKSMTVLHELGHFLDWSGLGSNPKLGLTATEYHPLLKEWREAVSKTKAYQEIESRILAIEKKKRKSKQEKDDLKHLKYLFQKEEIFARGYAQYIATKCSDPLIKSELDKMLESVYCKAYHTQWDADDFKILSEAYDNIFKAKGWII